MKIIPRHKVISTFETIMQAVESVTPGEVIKFEAKDSYDNQIDGEDKFRDQLDESRVCLATGPVFVEGAEKGDLIQVKILDIALADKGVAVTRPVFGVLGDMVKKARTRVVTKVDNSFFSFMDIKVAVKPMIGIIGVAPLEGKYSTKIPWKHGGNMDTNDITEGSTLYLPVGQKGGLLALGDCHALMGDGEIFSGCEISAEVIVKVDVIKKRKIEWPLVETKDYTMVIASGDNEFDAAKEASKQAVDFLSKGLGLSWDDALILASLTVDLKISQISNSKKTIRAAIPKYIVSTQKLIEGQTC
jgi:amidase